MISRIDYLNELLHHYLRNDAEQGLQLWAELFDQHLQAWDIKGCYQLLREIRRLDLDSGLGQLAFSLNKTSQAILAAHIRDWETAIRLYEGLLEVTPRENLAWTLSNLGNIYYLANYHDRALDTYCKALERYELAGECTGQARVLVNLGSIYRDMGKIRQALESLERASEIVPEGDWEIKAINLANWASALQVSGELHRAEEKYLQALQILDRFEAPHLLAQTYGNLATLYIAQAEPEQAIEYLLRDLSLHQELGDLGGQAETLNNLGLAHSKIGELERAFHFYEESAHIKKDLGDMGGELSTWNNYLIAAARNNYPIPHQVVERAKLLAKTANDEQKLSWLKSLRIG